MKYDFTTQVSRENTGSSKWDGMYAANPNVPEGTVPFPQQIWNLKPATDRRRHWRISENSIMGYTFATDAYYDAVIGWMKRRHNWDIKKEWIVEYPGVVPALYHMVNLFTAPGDGVLLFTPVYYPFTMQYVKAAVLWQKAVCCLPATTMRSILQTLKKRQRSKEQTSVIMQPAQPGWPCMDQRRTG